MLGEVALASPLCPLGCLLRSPSVPVGADEFRASLRGIMALRARAAGAGRTGPCVVGTP